ncbi:hypothetical protein ESA94_09545 [Lacibacter luteus]|uniref:Glycosyltransferase RgtA/B/C/D-like domain-containing protein n=1 Tax=Lacibacter luteus TaxID=2508719 RepID=A0A4Q1CJ68_9BACT|nr:hypothetical protein [Lacibacter luteus]RXK60696.1 hypothetical protein ESA94_09545 [Lacibacter luteus]
MKTSTLLFIVICFAILTRSLYLLVFPLQLTDYSLINTAAENFVSGDGLGFMRSTQKDLSTVYFEGLRLWPPLVPLSLSFFIKMTGSAFLANTILLLLILILFHYYLYNLLNRLSINKAGKIIVFLIVALNIDLIKQPGLSDLAAATFSIGATSCYISLILKKTEYSIFKLSIVAFLFFLPAAFRYQYYPLTILFPTLLYASGVYLKDLLLKKNALILFGFILTFITIQELFLFLYTSQPLTQSISMDESGFFPSNLAIIYPFFIKTFASISYIENRFLSFLLPIHQYYSFAIVILLGAWLYFLSKNIIQRKLTSEKNIVNREKTVLLSVLTILLTPILTLLLLSVTHAKQTDGVEGWTYVQEGRYYIGSSILVLVLTTWFIQNNIKHVSKLFFSVGKFCLLLILSYNLLLTASFYKNLITKEVVIKGVNPNSDRKKVEQIIDHLNINATKKVITYNDASLAFYPYKKNVVVTQKISSLNETGFETSQTIQLLIIADKPINNSDSVLIHKTNAKQISSLKRCTIYLAEISPSQQTNIEHN